MVMCPSQTNFCGYFFTMGKYSTVHVQLYIQPRLAKSKPRVPTNVTATACSLPANVMK